VASETEYELDEEEHLEFVIKEVNKGEKLSDS
jgi:hypothetical protein